MEPVKIGKNVLENLTSGMYQDSRIIFREYIQNAVDAARAGKYTKDDFYIDITIDKSYRKITIKDTASGIPKARIRSTLADVADSNKSRGDAAGFRGIGRLGGLAYCETLRFITTAKGEKQKTIMSWDAASLAKMLNDNTVKDDAGTILNNIISYTYEDCKADDHYFIVEIDRIKDENLDLLDIDKAREYIALNAPVPFDSKFIYKKDIYDYLNKKNFEKNEYKIYVNAEDIQKPYTTSLFDKAAEEQKQKYDEIYKIQIKEFFNSYGEMLAWMWFGISRFEKQIPFPLNEFAGIRLRQWNIQIGDENTLKPLFKESRGNLYFIGEVYAVHKNLIPNARRDYFNENSTINELKAYLQEFFQTELHSLYYDANKVKNALKKERDLLGKKQEYAQKQGYFINAEEKQKLEQDIEKAEAANLKAQKEVEKLKVKAAENPIFGTVFKHIEKTHEGSKNPSPDLHVADTGASIGATQPKKRETYLVDELSLPDKTRKLISKIYSVIQRNLPPEQANELIIKIQEELKDGKANTAD
jgi:molecular chaperone HtpG